MCCCGKPVKNGEPGYSWEGKQFSVRPVSPPTLPDGAVVVYDEPGRCQPMLGGKPYHVDHHSHHYQMVKADGSYRAFVAHGMGTVEFGYDWDWAKVAQLMAPMDSDSRFVLFMSIDSMVKHVERSATAAESAMWRQAAAEKRIKVRKVRGQSKVKVWIEDAVKEAAI